MLAVASGIVLWGVVLVVIATESIVARRRPPARFLIAWAAALSRWLAAYFAGFRPTPGTSDALYFLRHPLQFAAFVLVYLGIPIVQGTYLWLAGTVGLAGLVGFVGAFYAAVVRGFLTERILPWLWLSSYALLVAVVTGVGRVPSPGPSRDDEPVYDGSTLLLDRAHGHRGDDRATPDAGVAPRPAPRRSGWSLLAR